MRFLSISLSLLLHLALFLGMMQTVWLAPLDIPDIINVELMNTNQPAQEELLELPVQPEFEAPPVPVPPAELALPIPGPPPPVQSAQAENLPPAPADLPESVQLPEPETASPAAKEISPTKTLPPACPVEPAKDEVIQQHIIRQNDQTVHRGHEARMGRTLFADYYSYSSTEFSGQFTVKDRTVSIIDARKTKYGRFLIYDSKTGTLRRMKEYAKYIYTIGPSLYEDEPVIGSVTFLAKDDRIERFILYMKGETGLFPLKVHVRESEESVNSYGGTKVDTLTTLPPEGKGHPGVILIHGKDCVPQAMVQGFSRALGMNNVASMLFTPRGCGENDAHSSTGSIHDLARDSGKTLISLAKNPAVDANRVGLWGNGPGVPLTLLALKKGTVPQARFVVMVLNDTLDPNDELDLAPLVQSGLPSLWIITGQNRHQWDPLVSRLQQLQKSGSNLKILVSPTIQGTESNQAGSLETVWVNQVTQGIADPASLWIHSLKF